MHLNRKTLVTLTIMYASVERKNKKKITIDQDLINELITL